MRAVTSQPLLSAVVSIALLHTMYDNHVDYALSSYVCNSWKSSVWNCL